MTTTTQEQTEVNAPSASSLEASGSPREQPRDEKTQEDRPSPESDDKDTFTKAEKWLILAIVAFAGIFSPFTSSIYFPAIPVLTVVFNKSTELINLTVTMYIVLQGISPMVWGTLSDNIGRRPITAACLIVLSLSCVGLALVPTSAYWLLMVLRCLQAAGSASTIAIGAGVISDISTPAERAGFFGFFLLGPMVGPSLAPVVGGALTQGLGWRSIFWFLCIAVSACLVIIIIIMPETLPAVRYKTDKLSKIIYTPLIPVVGRKNTVSRDLPPKKKFQNPFKLFARFDIVLLLIINAITCAVYYGVIASLSTLFEQTYEFLDTTKVGLCFLAVGGGMGVGSTTNGKLLDKWYALEKKRFADKLSKDSEKDVDVKTVDKLPDFPLERARLYFIPVLIIILAACTAGYGWALEKGANIAVPLILQFIIGYMSMAIMNGSSTIMIDLAPGQGSAITACNNLVRCFLSAVLVSVIDLMFKSMGVGWTYVLLTGITLLSLPAIFLELRLGPEIRKKRLNPVSEQK